MQKLLLFIIHQKYIEHKKVIVEVFISWGVIQKLDKLTYAKTLKSKILTNYVYFLSISTGETPLETDFTSFVKGLKNAKFHCPSVNFL